MNHGFGKNRPDRTSPLPARLWKQRARPRRYLQMAARKDRGDDDRERAEALVVTEASVGNERPTAHRSYISIERETEYDADIESQQPHQQSFAIHAVRFL